MRRNVHRWFFIGFALSILTSIALFFARDAVNALRGLALSQAIVLVAVAGTTLCRLWSKTSFHSENAFHSRELRCKVGAQVTQRHRTYARDNRPHKFSHQKTRLGFCSKTLA